MANVKMLTVSRYSHRMAHFSALPCCSGPRQYTKTTNASPVEFSIEQAYDTNPNLAFIQ